MLHGLRRIRFYRHPRGALHAARRLRGTRPAAVAVSGGVDSWDCPCHASRFDTEGNVLHGPAPTPLEKIELAVDATPRPDAPRGGVRRPLR